MGVKYLRVRLLFTLRALFESVKHICYFGFHAKCRILQKKKKILKIGAATPPVV